MYFPLPLQFILFDIIRNVMYEFGNGEMQLVCLL